MSEKKYIQPSKMLWQENKKDFGKIRDSIGTVVRRMALTLAEKNSRSSFFSVLSKEIASWYPFDRLSINLYDSESEVLCFFTAAEGTVVSALSSLREANQNTVAGRVINTRKPVVISNLVSQFHGELAQPMTEAGLNCTMAFPLIENNSIIGTLHCSFVEEPSYFMELIDFFVELVPFITIFLSHVLAKERLQSYKVLQPLAQLPGVIARQDVVLFDTEPMREVMSIVQSVAALDVPVFITGETGTGKTLLAKYIHENSPRAGRNFIKVNCPSIAPTLIESELFGHIRGAFTGASSSRMGRIEMSQNGTLFLDEVAELLPDMQSKLLQVIEEKAFERVGESSQTSVDFRLISATNQNISEAVASNKLRKDFYYRLAAVNITVPPLRQREDDIPLLFEFMVNKQATAMGLPQLSLPAKLMNDLRAYSWPGNIREMRNVINRLLIKNTQTKITADILREALSVNSLDLSYTPPTNEGKELKADSDLATKNNENPSLSQNESQLEFDSLEEMERKYIIKAIKSCNGVISGAEGAAAKLGLARSTLQHKITKLGISHKN